MKAEYSSILYSSTWLFLLLSRCNHINTKLTTASQSGGSVLETSRSFHYWQPAPRWRLLPWLANPGNLAMSPHAEADKNWQPSH